MSNTELVLIIALMTAGIVLVYSLGVLYIEVKTPKMKPREELRVNKALKRERIRIAHKMQSKRLKDSQNRKGNSQ